MGGLADRRGVVRDPVFQIPVGFFHAIGQQFAKRVQQSGIECNLQTLSLLRVQAQHLGVARSRFHLNFRDQHRFLAQRPADFRFFLVLGGKIRPCYGLFMLEREHGLSGLGICAHPGLGLTQYLLQGLPEQFDVTPGEPEFEFGPIRGFEAEHQPILHRYEDDLHLMNFLAHAGIVSRNEYSQLANCL